MFSYDEYAALQQRAGLLHRSARGRLRLTGADRRAYLHGLLTNDIAALSQGHGCYAALLTPQGRMISDMRVSELGESVLIDLPLRAAEAVRTRLADFIFSEDVEVRDAQPSLGHLAVYGPEAAAVLSEVIGRAAAEGEERADAGARRERLEAMTVNANGTWEFGGSPLYVVRSDDYGVPGFELFPESDGVPGLARALTAAGTETVSLETVDVCRIEAGRPAFGIDMDEHTIPLEAGIEDRAISLTKGCYVGQEIIIRVLHRGHGRVAKRLVGFVAGADESLERGDQLYTTDDPAKHVGDVTSAVFSPGLRRPIGLGYVQRDHAEPGKVLAAIRQERASAQVTIVTMPFTPPAAE